MLNLSNHKKETYDDYKYDKELTDLLQLYMQNNKNFYDFRNNFLDKLKTNKHLTTTELTTLTGLAGAVKDKDLQLLLYKTLIEELVLIVTSLKE